MEANATTLFSSMSLFCYQNHHKCYRYCDIASAAATVSVVVVALCLIFCGSSVCRVCWRHDGFYYLSYGLHMVSRATFTLYLYVCNLTKTPCSWFTRKTRSRSSVASIEIDQTNVFQCIPRITHKLYGSTLNPIRSMQIEN